MVWLAAATVQAANQAGFQFGRRTLLLERAVIVLVAWRCFVLLSSVLDIICNTCLEAASIPADNKSVRFSFLLVKMLLMALGSCCVASNCGYDVSATLGGIGLTGMFLGLSSQAMLQDLFAWAVIVAQKPFSTGDFVALFGAPIGKVKNPDYF